MFDVPENDPEPPDPSSSAHASAASRRAWTPAAEDRPEASEPDDGERRRLLHEDLDALLDAERTDGGAVLGDALVRWDRLQRAIDGRLVGTVAGFSSSATWALDAYRSPAAWMVGSLGLKRAAAGSLRATCERAADHPELAAAAAAGRLSLAHLRALLDARVAPLEDRFDDDVDELIEAAAARSVDALVRRLRRWRLDALAELGRNDPDGAPPEDPGGSTCRVLDLLWGRAKVELDLDPADAAEFKAALEREHEALRRSGALAADPRSLREVHGDLAMDLWRRGIHRDEESAVPAPLVNVVVDLDTLLQRAGPGDDADRSARRAEIAGHGPVEDRVIAELAARGGVALLVTHPATGVPLWYGRTRRLASAAQRAAVIAVSDGHCQFPGCTVPAARCEIDHRVGWVAGGETNIDDLLLVCPFHNRLKHRWHLQVERGPDGALTWTHPTGSPIRSRYETGDHHPPARPPADRPPLAPDD
jgi:hypothetical protein